jgi:ABC-2 type transport system permease protein
MEVYNLFWRNVKWRFQNPATIMMTLMQPLFWLLLFSTMFGGNVTSEGANVNYTAFILPGILVMVVLTSAGMSGIANYSLKTGGSFYRIYISPVRRTSIVLAHILDAAVLSFIEVIVLVAISFLMKVNIASGFLGFLLIIILLFLTILFIAGMSYALSFLFQDENPFIALVNMFMLPLFFISTALMPYEKIPGGFKIPVILNPLTHVINSLRSVILKETVDWPQIIFTIMLLAVLGLGSFTFAIYRLNKENK